MKRNTERNKLRDKKKFISDDYLHMHKTFQLFTSVIIANTNIFTSIKVIKSTQTHIYTKTAFIKNAKLIKAWVK